MKEPHPGILAKTVTTLDVLSGGRAWLGIDAAWYELEHRRSPALVFVIVRRET